MSNLKVTMSLDEVVEHLTRYSIKNNKVVIMREIYDTLNYNNKIKDGKLKGMDVEVLEYDNCFE